MGRTRSSCTKNRGRTRGTIMARWCYALAIVVCFTCLLFILGGDAIEAGVCLPSQEWALSTGNGLLVLRYENRASQSFAIGVEILSPWYGNSVTTFFDHRARVTRFLGFVYVQGNYAGSTTSGFGLSTPLPYWFFGSLLLLCWLCYRLIRTWKHHVDEPSGDPRKEVPQTQDGTAIIRSHDV